MKEVDICTLVSGYENYGTPTLTKEIPDNIIIVGEIYSLIIQYEYDQLNLSRVECRNIYYQNKKGNSIKNHILPKSLKILYCFDNKLTSLPKLPNSLKYLSCYNNQLTSLPDLPNSLETLQCNNNRLTLLPKLPNSLKFLYCHINQLTLLPKLPNSLKYLSCYNNQLTSIPNICRILILYCNFFIDYIDYDPDYQEINIIFHSFYYDNELCKSYIEIKDYGRITSKEEYIQYMEKIKLSKIKSARK